MDHHQSHNNKRCQQNFLQQSINNHRKMTTTQQNQITKGNLSYTQKSRYPTFVKLIRAMTNIETLLLEFALYKKGGKGLQCKLQKRNFLIIVCRIQFQWAYTIQLPVNPQCIYFNRHISHDLYKHEKSRKLLHRDCVAMIYVYEQIYTTIVKKNVGH